LGFFPADTPIDFFFWASSTAICTPLCRFSFLGSWRLNVSSPKTSASPPSWWRIVPFYSRELSFFTPRLGSIINFSKIFPPADMIPCFPRIGCPVFLSDPSPSTGENPPRLLSISISSPFHLPVDSSFFFLNAVRVRSSSSRLARRIPPPPTYSFRAVRTGTLRIFSVRFFWANQFHFVWQA